MKQRPRLDVIALTFVALLGGSLPGAHGIEPGDDPRPFAFTGGANRPRLTLTFVDYTDLTTAMLAGVQDQTASLVGTLGVDVDLQTIAPGGPLDPKAVTIILVNGKAPRNMTRGVMGAVQRQGVLRVLWIYPANVASGAGMGWNRRGRWSGDEHLAFATAMARVAVHEVVHLACPWREHDDHGLMAGVVNRATLTKPGLKISGELRHDFALGVNGMSGASFAVAHGGDAARH